MEPRLSRIRIAGFRSLREVELTLGPLTVLIGPNGAGKSNLLWALELTRLLAHQGLQRFVGERGGASYLMHYGPKQTPAIELELDFTGDTGQNSYQARLGYGADESLIFLSEKAGFRADAAQPWRWIELGAGHRESALAAEPHATAKTTLWLLRRINFYHFHDTSRNSPLRTLAYEDAGDTYLRSDGSNLPAFLAALRDAVDQPDAQAAWRRIQGALRQIAPFIATLNPERDRRQQTRLAWVDDRGAQFGPAHLSDGTLRALALITALAQPEQGLPILSSVDEPELGLHPAALELICGLISGVAARRQVIVATQSPALLNYFEPDQVVVAERHDGATQFRRLDPVALASWLEDYSLAELFAKNLLGGRP